MKEEDCESGVAMSRVPLRLDSFIGEFSRQVCFTLICYPRTIDKNDTGHCALQANARHVDVPPAARYYYRESVCVCM